MEFSPAQAALVAAALAFEHAFSEGPMRPTRQVGGQGYRGTSKPFFFLGFS